MFVKNKYLKRFSCVLFVTLMVLSFTFGSYKKAQATADIVLTGGAVIGVETAIGWCLSAMGLVAASEVVYDNRDSLLEWCSDRTEDFKTFCNSYTVEYSDISINPDDLHNWLENLSSGTLDKASDCWQAFKSWCVSLTDSGSNPDVVSITNVNYDMSNVTVDETETSFQSTEICGTWNKIVLNVPTKYPSLYTFYSNQVVTPVAVGFISSIDANALYMSTCSLSNYSFTPYKYGSSTDQGQVGIALTCRTVNVGDKKVYVSWWQSDIQNNGTIEEKVQKYGLGSDWTIGYYPYKIFDEYENYKLAAMVYLDKIGELEDGYFATHPDVISSSHTQNILDRDKNLDNYDIVGSNGRVTDKVINLDWTKIGTMNPDGTIDITDSLADSISRAIDGAIPVQDTAVITDIATPYDDVQDVTIKGGVPVVDTTPDNTTVKDYTVLGLEKYFPFCIPFDFVHFLNVLSSEPVAPKFEWNLDFLDDLGFNNQVITIDLSKFDSVASIMRNMELLAFIIGLILVTRSKFIRS